MLNSGQFNDERGALAELAFSVYFTAVRIDKFRNRCLAQAGVFSDVFSSEEGIKQIFQDGICYPTADFFRGILTGICSQNSSQQLQARKNYVGLTIKTYLNITLQS